MSNNKQPEPPASHSPKGDGGLSIWEIDWMAERCQQLVDDWASEQHVATPGVPTESHKAMLMAKHRHVVDAARWLLLEQDHE
jgi:hypothetical protein